MTLDRAAAGAATATDLLIVLNKSDDEAVLVNPTTLAIETRIPTGHGPHEAAVTPDGRRAFVCNYGLTGVFRDGERKDEPGNTLSVVDLDARAVVDTIRLGEYTKPHGIWVSGDGKHIWLTCEGAQSVLELSVKDGAVGKVWKTSQDVSHMLVPTPDEKKLYVANIRSGSVSVVDRAADSVQTIPTGAGAEGIDVTPDGSEVWVTNRAANTISVIPVDEDAVTASFESGGTMPIRVKFTPDGREAWVTNAKSDAITIFDVASRKLTATLPAGKVPIGMQMSPDGRRVFIANTNDNRITVIDVRRRITVGEIQPGNEPDGMAWARRS
jgi:YVTN family beta-propeller protein